VALEEARAGWVATRSEPSTEIREHPCMRPSAAPPLGTQGARAVEVRAVARPMSVWAGLASQSASSSPAAAEAAEAPAPAPAAMVVPAAELAGRVKTVARAAEGLGALPGPAATQVLGAITLSGLRAPAKARVEMGNLAVPVGRRAAAVAEAATYKAAEEVAAALEARAAVAMIRVAAAAAAEAQAGQLA
jgi:hypothetical protein